MVARAATIANCISAVVEKERPEAWKVKAQKSWPRIRPSV
jgi:hypothetical protein